jgi:Ca2+-binding RTX toxin-like protein
VNVIAGTRGNDRIDLGSTVVQNIDHIDAGAGNDRVTGTSHADLIIGGRGRDRLNGGFGNDIYQFARGDGKDDLVDSDYAPNTDVLEFASGIAHDQLWFRQRGNDLELRVIGTRDQVVISDWYEGKENQIEEIHAGDGYMVLNSQVDHLVQAMAAFAPPASGDLNLSPELQIRLEPVLAANWH